MDAQSEAVKKFLNEQKHLTPRRRGAKERRQLFFAIFAPLRETVTTANGGVNPPLPQLDDAVAGVQKFLDPGP
jgi:hypothetical protein